LPGRSPVEDKARLRTSCFGAAAFAARCRRRRLVGSAGNAPARRFRHIFYDARFTVGQPDHFPEIGSGSGSHTHLKKFMRLLSVPWSSFPQLKRWLAEPQLACRFNKVRLRALRFDATAFARRVAAGEGWWSRWVTLPHQLACRASALLVCHDPGKNL
jgi:hypothetical protein